MGGSCQPPGVLRRREACPAGLVPARGAAEEGGGTVHAAASRLAACCNVWWRLQHPVRVCSWGNLRPAEERVWLTGCWAVGCWHLASHLQLRVQPQVSGARDITAFVYRSAGGRKRGRSLRGRGPLTPTRAPPLPPRPAIHARPPTRPRPTQP